MSTNSLPETIIMVIIMILAFIPAIVFHEYSHGYAAYRLGDSTAKSQGRLSINPLHHIDPFGTVILPGILMLSSVLLGGGGMIFGYAKPVPYNPNNFKNVRRGEVIVGLAGPASNIVMALIGAAIAYLSNFLYGLFAGSAAAGIAEMIIVYIWYFGTYFCTINLCLCFFNLIPIPPLDGSSIIAPLLSDNGLRIYYRVQRYGMLILIVLVILLPYLFGIDIIGWYLNVTAGNIAGLLLP